MKYLFAYLLLLLPVLGISMEPVRENKLIVSMVQNNTRSFYRLSTLCLKGFENKKMSLLQKIINAKIKPFFLAERLDQKLPSKEIGLENYYVLKDSSMKHGYVKIENVMEPEDFVILFIKQECVFETQKRFSLHMGLYDSRLAPIRTIAKIENCLLQKDYLHTFVNIIFNAEKLAEVEICATPSC